MLKRALLVVWAAAWTPLACGPEAEIVPETGAPAAGTGEIISVDGMYEVSGLTVEKESGRQREISGTIILTQKEDRYTATFNLVTMYPTPDGPLKSDVIGKGEGEINGRLLMGTAQTQIVAAAVPRVDPKFAFIPRRVGKRLVSTTSAQLAEDGTLTINIDNEPAEGADYAATKTRLRGARIETAEVEKPPSE